jgi:hypothetical protein
MRYTSTPPYALKACCLSEHRHKFTCIYFILLKRKLISTARTAVQIAAINVQSFEYILQQFKSNSFKNYGTNAEFHQSDWKCPNNCVNL